MQNYNSKPLHWVYSLSTSDRHHKIYPRSQGQGSTEDLFFHIVRNTEFHAPLVISYGDKDPIKPIYVWKLPLREVHMSMFLWLCL